MSSIEEAKTLIKDFGVTNIGIFPGTNQDTTAEQVAEQIVKLLREEVFVDEDRTGVDIKTELV